MWSLLSRKQQLTITIGAGLLVAIGGDAILAFIYGYHPGWWKLTTLAVAVVGGVLVFLAEVSWRPIWRMFPAVQAKTFPDLNGVWTGTLISTWIDPETGQPKPPIDTTITIRQRLFSTDVSLKTGESGSHSTRVWLERFPETRRFRIWYSYNNEPRAILQHRSSPHEGVAFLELAFETDPNRMTGRYYTARQTMGDLDVSRQVVSRARRGRISRRVRDG